MSIKLSNVSQRYPNAESPLYENFSAEFGDNKIHAVLGASGCGKTTLLNIIAGLCSCEGEVLCSPPSYVFQDARLIESISVRSNLELVLRRLQADKVKRAQAVDDKLRMVEMESLEGRYPDSLSGGERQRVALARAFLYPSETLLLDEPFNSLDYGVKSRIINQFLDMFEQSPRTTLFVTHNVDEALALADEIYILQGTPAELRHVASLFDDKRSRDIHGEGFVSLRRELTAQL